MERTAMKITIHNGAAKRSLIVAGAAGLIVASAACSKAAPTPIPTAPATSTPVPAATTASASGAASPNSGLNALTTPAYQTVSTGDSVSSAIASTGVAPAPVVTLTSPDGSTAISYAGLIPYPGNAGSDAGINVSGNGSVDVQPDIAVLNLAIEARDATVTVARDQAAQGMTDLINAIKAHGVSADDIQTTGFSIQPQTVYKQITGPSGNYQQPEINGYIVTNSITVTVRDLNKTANVIDAAAQSAGNLLRFNGVNFSVSDSSKAAAQARMLAAHDAKAKAQAYADAMGVQLGPLVSLSETGGSVPLVASYPLAMDKTSAASMPTPLNPGSTKIRASVQARYAIIVSAQTSTTPAQ